MTQQLKDMLAAASKLSLEERAELVERLLMLETVDPEIDGEWVAQGERRLAAYNRGELVAEDADAARAFACRMKIRQIVVASRELEDVSRRCDAKAQSRGDRFQDEYARALRDIAEYPMAWHPLADGSRHYRPRDLPLQRRLCSEGPGNRRRRHCTSEPTTREVDQSSQGGVTR